MRDIQISRPLLIAVIGAVLIGGFFLYQSQSSEEVAPPPPVATPTAATGATGSSGESGKTGATGESGATGETKKLTAAEKREKARKERRAKALAAAKEKGMPLSVYEGLKDNKVVMIFFYNPEAKADRHVNDAVKEVKNDRGKKLLVIREKIANKSKYQGIAKVAEITQTPGIVLLYGTAADAWMGYIDGVALDSRISVVIAQGG
jgi:hypothetical protein